MNESAACIYCGTRLPVQALACPSCHSQVTRTRCKQCAREWVAGTVACACGARLEGVVAAGAPCPRCEGASALTLRQPSPECSFLECRRCGGALTSAPTWGELIERASQNDPRFVGVGGFGDKALTLAQLLPFVSCPGCKREMDRIAFAGRTRISLDVCTLHGIWFDGGELGKVLGILHFKNTHGGDLPPPSRAGGELDTQARREQVLQSMGIADPLYDLRRPPLAIRHGFSPDRVAGRVALLAGGFEGAAAYELLKAVASGASVAAEWALRRGSGGGPALSATTSSTGPALPPLRCLYCGTSHPEAATECVRCRTPIARVFCTACGSRVAAGEERCHCGAPLSAPAAKGELPCPRCKCALDPLRLDGKTTAHRCVRCLGAFFDIHDWSTLVDQTVAGAPLALASFTPLPPGRELPSATLMAGARCPRCTSPMERITFAGTSRVVVDVCSLDGIWLDAGELVALCAFVRAGAPVPQGRADPEGDETVKEWGRR